MSAAPFWVCSCVSTCVTCSAFNVSKGQKDSTDTGRSRIITEICVSMCIKIRLLCFLCVLLCSRWGHQVLFFLFKQDLIANIQAGAGLMRKHHIIFIFFKLPVVASIQHFKSKLPSWVLVRILIRWLTLHGSIAVWAVCKYYINIFQLHSL